MTATVTIDERDLLLAQLSAMENECERLRRANQELHQQLRDRDRIIRHAKDIESVQRPSL